MENKTMAQQLANLLETSYASLFESVTGDGRAFGQFTCPDGSHLVIEVDCNGCVGVRLVSDATPNSMEFDQVLVDAGRAP